MTATASIRTAAFTAIAAAMLALPAIGAASANAIIDGTAAGATGQVLAEEPVMSLTTDDTPWGT